MFDSLAESARRYGAQLSAPQSQELTKQATVEPNLKLPTAASQTLGAMNLPAEKSAGIILALPER